MPDYDRKTSDTSKPYADLHATAMERFKLAESANSDQAKRELADLKFAARIGQWTDAEQEARKPITAGALTLGARPCLTVDKLRQPIQQLENQQRQANLAVDVHPKGDGATKATSDVLQGLYRNIQVESRADQIGRFWAYSRALKVGRGVYRVEKKYVLDNPKPDDPARFDQKIVISRVLNQASVLFDPFATEPDWSDGEWAFEKAWVPKDRYQKDNTGTTLADCDDDAFVTIGTAQPGWVKQDKGTWMVLEVRYWYVQYGAETTVTGDTTDQIRKVRERTVCTCKMNAKEIYDHQTWDGQYIPLIPVIANEENIDGDRLWEGMVAPAKDSQRTFNFLTSAFIETVALAPKAPWVVDVKAIEPFQAWWAQSNVRNFPYLPYQARVEGGSQVPPPQRLFSEPPIQAIAQGIHQFDANINATTGFFDPSRGNLSSGERSGVALQALQKQSETGNSGYLDNLAQISMTYESMVVLDLIPSVYDRPGRIERVLKDSNKSEMVMLNAPYVLGPDGQPIAPPLGAQPGDILEHNLRQGVFGSTVTIGKSHTTARQESAELIGGIIQAEPQLLMILGDLWFANLDGPGMPELAARMKKMLPPQLQEKPEGQQDAAALQQQLGQAQQTIQQLQPLADANQAKLQQAQIDADSKEKIAQLQEQTQKEIEQIKADALLRKAELDAMAATQTTAAKAQADLTKTVMQQQGEDHRQAMDHAHEAAGHVLDLHSERDVADTTHAHAMQQTDAAAEHARTLQREKPSPKGKP